MPGEPDTQRHIAGLVELAEFRFELRRFLAFSEAAAERRGISAQQYQLLQVLGTLPKHEAASISHLAERMILRHNSMVELVDRAERAGLVRRKEDDRDLRRSVVGLTEHGLDLLEVLVADHLQELGGARQRLVAALQRLSERQTDEASATHAR